MHREIPLVLIVDDTSANIHTLSTLLKDMCAFKVANSGETAIEIAKLFLPDLILLDILMPGLDGFATCKALKEDIATASIPIIFVTAQDSAEDEARGFELGAVDYIVKPFNPVIVRARVATHLRLKRLTNSLKEEVEKEVCTRMHVQKKLAEQEVLIHQQSKLASMGEMIGAIAHQWRQPLNALNLAIQNLDDDFEEGLMDKAFINTFITKNKQTIQFMSKTIDSFRDFFRIDKEKKEFSIEHVIQETMFILSGQMKSNNIEVLIQGEDVCIYSLKSEFQQVILNIVNNAKDAILEKKIENGKIIMVIFPTCITIEDNAGGIKEEIIEHVFEPYFTTKEQGKGTGIGLYMSKMIVEKNMGGKLEVQNTPNGAQFTIWYGV